MSRTVEAGTVPLKKKHVDSRPFSRTSPPGHQRSRWAAELTRDVATQLPGTAGCQDHPSSPEVERAQGLFSPVLLPPARRPLERLPSPRRPRPPRRPARAGHPRRGRYFRRDPVPHGCLAASLASPPLGQTKMSPVGAECPLGAKSTPAENFWPRMNKQVWCAASPADNNERVLVSATGGPLPHVSLEFTCLLSGDLLWAASYANQNEPRLSAQVR